MKMGTNKNRIYLSGLWWYLVIMLSAFCCIK